MAQQKEFESLDELFRKTFDSLPNTPSNTGWDVPSDKVWQHVQTQIAPPKSGWSTMTWSLVASLGVAIVLGLYFSLRTPATTAPAATTTSVATAPVATTEAVIEANTTVVNTTTTDKTPKNTVIPVSDTKHIKKASIQQVKSPILEKTPAVSLPEKQEKVSQPLPNSNPFIGSSNDGEATLLPGVKAKIDDAQNTTEKLRQELAKQSALAWKINLTPLPFKPLQVKNKVTLPVWMKK